MNIIFGRHEGCNKDFCWEVPNSMKNYISKGDILLVETRNGLDIAVAITGIINGDGVKDIAENKGAYFPLKSVVSFANKPMKQYIYNWYKNMIIGYMHNHQCFNELPF